MSDAPLTTPANPVARQLGPNDKGAAGFLKWLKVSMPAVYNDLLPDFKRLNVEAKVAAKSAPGMGAFGDAGDSFQTFQLDTSLVTQPTVPAGTGDASSSWTDTVSKLISAWGQYKLTDQQLDTAKQITNINLQRAQQGLSPLPYDASQLGLSPTVKVGLTGDTGKLLMYGGFAFVGFLVLNSIMKHRRA